MDPLAYLKSEFAVLSKAPFTAVVVAVFFFIAGYYVASWYLDRQLTLQNERLADLGAQISRYRQALGVDPVSPSALTELTNEELRAKALTTAADLRTFAAETKRVMESAERSARSDAEQRTAGLN